MNDIVINKTLMMIKEQLKSADLDYMMIEPSKDGIEVSVRFFVKDKEESEALGNEN